jgi:hypothetical protein
MASTKVDPRVSVLAKYSNPSLVAATVDLASGYAVRIIAGVDIPSPRNFRTTSIPEKSGSRRSRSHTSNRCACARATADLPSMAVSTCQLCRSNRRLTPARKLAWSSTQRTESDGPTRSPTRRRSLDSSLRGRRVVGRACGTYCLPVARGTQSPNVGAALELSRSHAFRSTFRLEWQVQRQYEDIAMSVAETLVGTHALAG